MVTYKENQFMTQLSDSDTLTVGDTIYISVIIPDLDTNALHVKVVNIFASPTNSSDQKYYLLQNGCPASDVTGDQLTVGSNGVGAESRFAMKVFQITSFTNIYLYADLVLCTTDCNSTCSSQSITIITQPIAGNTGTFMNAADYYYNGNSASVSVPCGRDSCADDEYCVYNTTCQCDTTLYTYTGSLPSPNFTCTGVKFNIQVSKCWLEANGYNTSEIRLNSTNPECFAVRQIVDGTSEMIIYRPLIYSDCNTEAMVNATHVTYTNQLYISAKTDPIQTQNDVVMNISCSLPLNINVALNVTLHPVLGSTEINDFTVNASYAAVMMAFKDNTYTTLLSEDDPLTVEDPIYLSVQVPDLNVNTFKLMVVNIYASPTNSSDQMYYLLKDGCPSSDVSADELTVDSNGVGAESRFLMKVFQITDTNIMYLYADLALCTTDCASNCSPQFGSLIIQPITGNTGTFLDAVSAPVYCGSDSCAYDEFCDNSTTTCQCNSTLYTFIRGSPPSPNFTCTGGIFNIQVSKCWLEANGYNTSDIRLNSTDPECFAVNQNVNGISEMTLQRPLVTSDCNTVPAVTETHIIYTNQLSFIAKTNPIRIINDVILNISCSYPLNMDVSLLRLPPIFWMRVINYLTADGSYSFYMMAYKDNQFITQLSDSDTLYVGDTIYIVVFIPDLDVNTFKLKVVNIYASPDQSSDQKYYLLQDGCPASDVSADELTVGINGAGSEAWFAMKVFQITNSYTVYLYADLVLCTEDCNSYCSSQSVSNITQPISGNARTFMDAAYYDYYYAGNSTSVAAPASCGSDSCADDEICIDIDSTTNCQCNATVYPFIRGAAPDVNYTCAGAKFNIQVSKCWLDKNGYNTSDIRLSSTNPECWAGKEVVGGTLEMTLHRPLISSDCNTEAVVNVTHVTYTNQLYIFAKMDPIRITNDVIINISCSFPLYTTVTLHPTLGPIANASYSVYMRAYTDNQFVTPLSNSYPLYVEDTVYISVVAPDLDANTFNFKVVNIYASPTNSGSNKYYLLKNGLQ
ncbi:uncharacterized protein LOC120915895 [Rana temporaria]|uniref:uncharacterized protein LOC120915895 n=1 Tax=Rana temporaria TaxID=8407 RepID=UPI001AAD598C|nr:uncharacterized protein LOC120915895 [Rana temporaria]